MADDITTGPADRRAVLRGGAALVIAGIAAGVAGGPARAADARLTLIMVDEPGCKYCRKFDAEIGRGYGKTAEGRFAPLVRVRRKAPELTGFNPVIYTPTFILTRRGEELGRITGYPGAEFFYSELTDLLSKAGFVRGMTGGSSAT